MRSVWRGQLSCWRPGANPGWRGQGGRGRGRRPGEGREQAQRRCWRAPGAPRRQSFLAQSSSSRQPARLDTRTE
eukprot:5076790-Lingulodinium_polyedra.AAC.1